MFNSLRPFGLQPSEALNNGFFRQKMLEVACHFPSQVRIQSVSDPSTLLVEMLNGAAAV